MSSFEWGRMDRTPEGRLGREQLRRRSTQNSLEELAGTYDRQAREALSGKNAVAAQDEISRFAKKISAAHGPDQYESLSALINALRLRKVSFFDEIPDDEHERAAFALALVKQYEKSLQ